MKNLYPLRLIPVAKSAIWGGTRLARDWSKKSDLAAIAETWELTVRDKENNLVENGALSGKTLADVLRFWGKSALGTRAAGERFPLLVKFIDAADRLSVQVHPDDSYASAVEKDLGKTEMWYIVEADEGANILLGLAPGVTPEDFAAGVKKSDPEPLLNRVPVRAGDCFFIPAGMPHAIGKGILVAEIQQNCDLTYRVFDYNRRDKEGKLRELHVDKALAVTRPFTAEEVDAVRFARGKGDSDLLAACPYFTVRRTRVAGESTNRVAHESFHSLLFLSGKGVVEANGQRVSFAKGDSIFLAAGIGDYRIVGEGEVLVSTL